MENVSLYSEARNEYLKQMSTWIVPPVVEFFRREYATISQKEGKKAMSAFQNYCADIPKWNQDVIDTNVSSVLESCRCDYLEELMTAVFIAHTKMLTAIRVSSKQKKMKITLPKLDHFMHRFFIECARSFWKAPFLFSEEYSPIEKQKNVLQIEAMCIDALSGAVRSLLPVKSILTEYLEDSDEEEEEVDSTPAPQPAVQTTPLSAPLPTPIHAAEPESVIKPQAPSLLLSETENLSEYGKENQKVGVAKVEKVEAPAVSLVVKENEHVENESVIMENKVSNMPIIPDKHVIEKVDTVVDVPPNTPATKPEPVNNEPSRLLIDTEPSVHFTPYDTVFDENNANISEIRYTPKVSVEDKPPSMWGMSDYEEEEENEDIELPRLNISNTGSDLSMDDMEDLEAPVKDEDDEEEEEKAFADSNDFEELQ